MWAIYIPSQSVVAFAVRAQNRTAIGVMHAYMVMNFLFLIF